MLGREHNITYRPRTSAKGQILADFHVEKSDEALPDTSVVEIPQEPWILFMDGSSYVDGSCAGLILTSPEGMEFTYALRFQFTASKNKAEYEALIAGLRIAAQMGEEEVVTVVKEEGPTWMTSIIEYLKDETLPDDRKEASKLRIKARQYELLEWVLSERVILKACLVGGTLQVNHVIREIHEGSCNMHTGLRKGQVFNSRYGLFYEVDRGESCGDNHRQSGKEVRVRQHSMSLRFPRRNSFGQCETSAVQWDCYERANPKAWVGLRNQGPPRLRGAKLEWIEDSPSIREAKAKLKMTKYYNARVRGVTFRPGDFVCRSNEASHAMDEGKLGQKWEGPYKVTEATQANALSANVMGRRGTSMDMELSPI
ncbi:reverse transcriptase domain-containing protein [Tanacetum coccineum]